MFSSHCTILTCSYYCTNVHCAVVVNPILFGECPAQFIKLYTFKNFPNFIWRAFRQCMCTVGSFTSLREIINKPVNKDDFDLLYLTKLNPNYSFLSNFLFCSKLWGFHTSPHTSITYAAGSLIHGRFPHKTGENSAREYPGCKTFTLTPYSFLKNLKRKFEMQK